VHYDLSKNIETYYQEIGRSGRDGLPSTCLLLYGVQDVRTVKYIIDMGENPKLVKEAHLHLEGMLEYVNTDSCRRINILHWFGESYTEQNCGMCDNCLNQNLEQIEVTEQAQKFLSAIYRTGEVFGAEYIIDVLRGSRNKKVLANNHDKLSVYNVGIEWKKNDWYSLYFYLKKQNYVIETGEYNSLKLNEQSWKILRSETKVFLPKTIAAVLMNKTESECDMVLFDLLSSLRFRIAREKNLPAYIIFSDRTLMEMATYFPQSHNTMKLITGVGDQKLADYGAAFMQVIGDYCSEHGIAESTEQREIIPVESLGINKSSKAVQVCDYLAQGHSLQEAMINYEVKMDTILRHIQTYLEAGGKVNPENIIAASSLDPTERKTVETAFNKHNLLHLSPIYQECGEEFPYQELRIFQTWLMAKLNMEKL
jgi:ATP-dependent DNA helicase RecQ